MKIAVVYATYDGIISHYCGVGSVSRDFFQTFFKVKEHFEKEGVDLFLHPFTMHMTNSCYGYSEKMNEISRALIQKYPQTYSSITYLDNGTEGSNGYGNASNWMQLTDQIIDIIYSISNKYEKVIVIGLDAPFAECAEFYLNKYPTSSNVYFTYVLYSTSANHRGRPFSKLSNYSRYGWENSALSFMSQNKYCCIYACSDSFTEEVIQEYRLPEGAVKPVYNGIYFDRMSKNIISQNEIQKVLESKGIPCDKKILFSFGRCEPYKGYEYVIEAAKTAAKKDIITVLLLSQCDEKNSYLQQLKSQCSEIKEYVYFIEGLDMITPQYIMQWKNTIVLALMATKEPSGLIPVEARYYGNPSLTLIVSDRGGLPEQIAYGEDGFISKLDADDITRVFQEVFDLKPDQKAIISENGKRRIFKEHDVIKNNIRFVGELLKSAEVLEN